MIRSAALALRLANYFACLFPASAVCSARESARMLGISRDAESRGVTRE